ncbi:MAG: hypothetical protein ACR2M0_08495 [Chloroflexia bacterium]
MGLSQLELRTQLRSSLLDITPPLLWTDDVLNQCIAEAVTTHSLLFPFAATVDLPVALGQQSFSIYPVQNPGLLPPPVGEADLLAVQGVELPVGQPIPQDPWQSTDPAGSASSRYRQGWRVRSNTLTLRNPASGNEIGPATLRVELLQTWNLPDDGSGSSWNGPVHDVPLLVLLSKRSAYQYLAEWQARDQGITPALAPSGSGANLHIDVPPILVALEVQIDRALKLRQQRNLRSRALDI